MLSHTALCAPVFPNKLKKNLSLKCCTGVNQSYLFSDQDLDAVRHLMFLVGKNLGVKDEFNLCSGDLNECKAYCHEILVSVTEMTSQEFKTILTNSVSYVTSNKFKTKPKLTLDFRDHS